MDFFYENKIDFCPPLQVLCSNLSTSHQEPSDNSHTTEKYGYGQSGLDQRDKEAAGLFYLKTVYLPEQLEKNLQKYLKSKGTCQSSNHLTL